MSTRAGWRADRAYRFYRVAAWLALAVALAGFFLTYTLPMARGGFAGPRWSHVHGALLLSWLVLVIVQTHLARGSLALHRRLGWIALGLAPAVAISTVAIGLEATRRDIAAFGPEAAVGMAGNSTDPLIFLALVGAAIALRRDPQWHKRLILLATVVVLWPAWFRWRHFLPWVPYPDFTLALIAAQFPVIVAMIRDRVMFGAVHPAYLFAGIPLMVEQIAASVAFATGAEWWTNLGKAVYRLLA